MLLALFCLTYGNWEMEPTLFAACQPHLPNVVSHLLFVSRLSGVHFGPGITKPELSQECPTLPLVLLSTALGGCEVLLLPAAGANQKSFSTMTSLSFPVICLSIMLGSVVALQKGE
jgi:hypothetical protein